MMAAQLSTRFNPEETVGQTHAVWFNSNVEQSRPQHRSTVDGHPKVRTTFQDKKLRVLLSCHFTA
jgi:hypothetical protein